MAERSAEHPAVCLEFAFDRLLPIKLQQVYGLLVADCARPVRQASKENGEDQQRFTQGSPRTDIRRSTPLRVNRRRCVPSPCSKASAFPMNGCSRMRGTAVLP